MQNLDLTLPRFLENPFVAGLLGRSQTEPSTSAVASPPCFPQLRLSSSVYSDDDSDNGSVNQESMIDSSSFIPATPPRKKVSGLLTSGNLVKKLRHPLPVILFVLPYSPTVVQVCVLRV